MTKEDLITLLQLADLARQTGQISFDAMPTVVQAVKNAEAMVKKMEPTDTLTIRPTK